MPIGTVEYRPFSHVRKKEDYVTHKAIVSLDESVPMMFSLCAVQDRFKSNHNIQTLEREENEIKNYYEAEKQRVKNNPVIKELKRKLENTKNYHDNSIKQFNELKASIERLKKELATVKEESIFSDCMNSGLIHFFATIVKNCYKKYVKTYALKKNLIKAEKILEEKKIDVLKNFSEIKKIEHDIEQEFKKLNELTIQLSQAKYKLAKAKGTLEENIEIAEKLKKSSTTSNKIRASQKQNDKLMIQDVIMIFNKIYQTVSNETNFSWKINSLFEDFVIKYYEDDLILSDEVKINYLFYAYLLKNENKYCNKNDFSLWLKRKFNFSEFDINMAANLIFDSNNSIKFHILELATEWLSKIHKDNKNKRDIISQFLLKNMEKQLQFHENDPQKSKEIFSSLLKFFQFNAGSELLTPSLENLKTIHNENVVNYFKFKSKFLTDLKFVFATELEAKNCAAEYYNKLFESAPTFTKSAPAA